MLCTLNFLDGEKYFRRLCNDIAFLRKKNNLKYEFISWRDKLWWKAKHEMFTRLHFVPLFAVGWLATNRNLIIIRPTPNINSHLSNKLGPVYQHMVLNKQKTFNHKLHSTRWVKTCMVLLSNESRHFVLIVTILTCDFCITNIGN